MRYMLLKQALAEVKAVHASIEDRSEFREYRRSFLEPVSERKDGLRKIAFDTRRINQETDFNPRRGAQFYHRSEEYINDELASKITNLIKVKNATDVLKKRLGKEPEWQDSYARVLHAALERVLRVKQQDGDFSSSQLDYVNELLYMRYRLPEDQLVKLNEQELAKIILKKDECLVRKDLFAALSEPLLSHDDQHVVKQMVKSNDSSAVSADKVAQEMEIGGASKDSKGTQSITINIVNK